MTELAETSGIKRTKIFPRLGNVILKFLEIKGANCFVTLNILFAKDMQIRSTIKTTKIVIDKLTNVTISWVTRITFTVSYHN